MNTQTPLLVKPLYRLNVIRFYGSPIFAVRKTEIRRDPLPPRTSPDVCRVVSVRTARPGITSVGFSQPRPVPVTGRRIPHVPGYAVNHYGYSHVVRAERSGGGVGVGGGGGDDASEEFFFIPSRSVRRRRSPRALVRRRDLAVTLVRSGAERRQPTGSRDRRVIRFVRAEHGT